MNDWGKLAVGLLLGFPLGFLIQKGQVAKPGVVRDQFLWRDFTGFKVLFTALIVGGGGVLAMNTLGWVRLTVLPVHLAPIGLGAVLFGAGMVVLGYCPLTVLAGLAEGRRDALYGLVGMFAGAAAFAELAPVFEPLKGRPAELVAAIRPLEGIWPWIRLGVLALGVLLWFLWLERRHPDPE